VTVTKKKKGEIDSILFAVIKARVDGIINEMTEVILSTARNPILYSAKDFTCSILTYDMKLLTMANSLPIHLLSMDSSLRAVVKCFGEDIHTGDCFVNNDPYYGNTHVGDWTMFVPVFYKEELICWVAALCHLIDTGAHVPTNVDPLAKDVYEEGIHFPPMRIAKDYKEIPEIIRFIKANFRYPEQWYGDFLAQIGALWKGEQAVLDLCKKYGSDVIKKFQDNYLNYGERCIIGEIKKIPKGTWSTELLSEKVEPIAPKGVLLRIKMNIDPNEAMITYDLTKVPDQLPWGYNLSAACARGACIQGTMACLNSNLPRNYGVYKHIRVLLREGSVAGIPKWPVGTSCATTAIADEITNMVFRLWEQVEPGRGHADSGYVNPTTSFGGGTDFRRKHTPYGHTYNFCVSGGGASKGYDGWPTYFCNAIMGNMSIETVELNELKIPNIIWEWTVKTDSGGAGKWRGAVALETRIQPRHQTITVVNFGTGMTCTPREIAGGGDGSLSRHWIEKHVTREKVQELGNTGVFHVREDEDWVGFANGGGGYGDPLERDPDKVSYDARNGFISVIAARDIYGVVLNTQTEFYDVNYKATTELRKQLKQQREYQQKDSQKEGVI